MPLAENVKYNFGVEVFYVFHLLAIPHLFGKVSRTKQFKSSSST